MESRIDILNEIKALSPFLAEIEKLNVFTVPEGYFNFFSDDVLAILKEENSNIKFGNVIHFTTNVPQGYFDSLAETVLARVKEQQEVADLNELRILSPMLYSIQNENVFTVPQGYFETLSDNINNKIKPQRSKVITIGKRSNTFIKYAVAAAFTGMMALGVFKFSGSPANALPDYVTDGLKSHNVDEELSQISDVDLIKYLQANGENVDAQTVANQTLDEKDLPNQADYLVDDKALDKYMDNINTNDLKN